MSSAAGARPARLAGDFGSVVGVAPNASVGRAARLTAPPAAVTDLMKVRRVGDIRCIPSERRSAAQFLNQITA